MRTLTWLGRVLLVPAIGVALLAGWVVLALGRSAYDMSSWAALLLFGGFALSRAVPRVALVALAGAFALQFVRPDCRFDSDGWTAYAAIPLAAIVYGAATTAHRRRRLGALLGLGLLIALFADLPALGTVDRFATDRSGDRVQVSSWGLVDGVGVVNGKSWTRAASFSDGEIVVGTAAWTAGAVLLVLGGWTIGSGYRARRLQWAAEARSDADRAALAASTSDLRLAEQRDRIVQDVHDLTAHRLSVIQAQADGAAARTTDAETRSALLTISGSARSALGEIRTLLENLEGPDAGDTAHDVGDVRVLLARSRDEGIDVVLEEHGEPAPLSAATGLAAYRIVQEALTNAVRHGRPGAIRVTLDWREDGLAVVVASPLGAPPAAGIGRGLPGMRERARSVGGWLTTGADDGVYLVTAVLPVTGEHR